MTLPSGPVPSGPVPSGPVFSGPLPTRPLGNTGMDITTVGFGAWAIGGGDWQFGWGKQDDEESIAGIRHAVESGINWVDTAAVYGLGHSEEVVASGAGRHRAKADRPYVFTKVGVSWDPADRSAPTRRMMNPAIVRREVDASLRRLAGRADRSATRSTGRRATTGRRSRSTGR